jgi:hypothetical protein
MENRIVKEQTEKQKYSKSPLFGYRKPVTDDFGTWCNCTNPTLTSSIGRGTAYCLRCQNYYYH